jgi:hypothetical protein
VSACAPRWRRENGIFFPVTLSMSDMAAAAGHDDLVGTSSSASGSGLDLDRHDGAPVPAQVVGGDPRQGIEPVTQICAEERVDDVLVVFLVAV